MEQLGPGVAKPDLPDRRRRLRILEARAPTLRQLQPPRAERDRPRRDDRDPLPGGMTSRDMARVIEARQQNASRQKKS